VLALRPVIKSLGLAAMAAMFPALSPVGAQTSVRWYGSKFAQLASETTNAVSPMRIIGQ
jgi:hypothetical protein